MTETEAIAQVLRITNYDSHVDKSLLEDIKSDLELTKRKELQEFVWKFARDILSVDVRFLFSFDTNLEFSKTINNYDFEKVCNDFDLFYLVNQGYTFEEVIAFFRWLSITKSTAGFTQNNIQTKFTTPVDVTLITSYFDYILDIFGDSDYIKFRDDVLFSINSSNKHDYDPKTIFQQITFETYKTNVETFLAKLNPYKVTMQTTPTTIPTILKTFSINDMQYCYSLGVECTINKPIGELPDEFMLIVCKAVASQIATANNNLNKANILFTEYQRYKRERKHIHSSENNDIREVEFVQNNRTFDTRDSLW